ncbi:hypothetical protein KUTeg_003799 [Tegillarca granosa]|uniref:phosphatidate cytidylyltransferase n=1 Tax=Tegillarca granosa TaxID=220873 RepID=A0ABQ9FN48_TEGGR|nr:hypothetical protein KUTeg_003799 [Tegillarca granosa]
MCLYCHLNYLISHDNMKLMCMDHKQEFGWTHVTLLIVVTQSHLIMQNVFEGLIWYVVGTGVYDHL